ncbi:MAG TPA: Smr/MutS family protein [Saprospiraceae bacterium]|nr:Smr/MutS family protein [Saprospiraceae bacterium]
MAINCLTDEGAQLIAGISPSTDVAKINLQMTEIAEMMQAKEEGFPMPFTSFESIQACFERLRLENAPLSLEEMQLLFGQLALMEGLHHYFKKIDPDYLPLQFNNFQAAGYQPELYSRIKLILDDDGSIRPDASRMLIQITHQMQEEEKVLDRTFARLINTYRQQGYLGETLESVRNGRRVFAVHSEHKRKIRGIIHDESTTGRTAYVEPDEIIQINNNLFDLQMSWRKEVHRILSEFTAFARHYREDLIAWQDYLWQLDSIRAKALFSELINAKKPSLSAQPEFALVEARHPLLFLKNRESGKETIPLSVQLGYPKRLALLSGPNAGGKSVALKTIALCQWMAQCGLLIAASEDSTIGIFEEFVVDIGDQQSIEDDLSTYSSRLKLMQEMIRMAGARTLVFIDEFGTGTDPKIGGAIAEAVLMRMHDQQVKGVITTHYSNLKILANHLEGMVNGAMLFNRKDLKPTYRMRLGRPGSSFALEIAEKIGLDEAIIQYAKQKMGNKVYYVDQLLSDLEQERIDLQRIMQEHKEKINQADKLMRTYQQMQLDLEVKRKKLKLETKQKALQDNQQSIQAVEKLVRELRKAQKVEKAEEKLSELKSEQKELHSVAQKLDTTLYVQETRHQKPIAVGDFVRHNKSDWVGEVLRLDKGQAVLQIGAMQVTLPVNELRHGREPLPVRGERSVQTTLHDHTFDFGTQLDIRGLKKGEAEKIVEGFIDKAVLANAWSIKILHGKGNGVLKQVVLDKLSDYPTAKIYHPDPESGGDGITIAQFHS